MEPTDCCRVLYRTSGWPDDPYLPVEATSVELDRNKVRGRYWHPRDKAWIWFSGQADRIEPDEEHPEDWARWCACLLTGEFVKRVNKGE